MTEAEREIMSEQFEKWFENEFPNIDRTLPGVVKGMNNMRYGWNAALQSREGQAVKGWKLIKLASVDERSYPEDADHENGNYFCECLECQRQFVGHKRRQVCKVCAAAPTPPQDDLAEVKAYAEKLREALEAAQPYMAQSVEQLHEALKGYKPNIHKQADADMEQVTKALDPAAIPACVKGEQHGN
jgi:hypothetical protein